MAYNFKKFQINKLKKLNNNIRQKISNKDEARKTYSK